MATSNIIKAYSKAIPKFISRKQFLPPVAQCCARSSSVPVTKVPLNQSLPGFPTPAYITPRDQDHETLVTTLDNGLRVASQNKFGQFCTVGVVLDSGSRYETFYPSGISHFLEKLAFNSTVQYSSKDAILQELERHGGICDCQGSRDTLIYAASAYSKGLDPVIGLLSEAVLRPLISEEELELARQTIQFELEDLHMKPDQEAMLLELIHAAAYHGNTLGLPKLCPPDNIKGINRRYLLSYLREFFTPRRMVVAGVGVEHQALVDSVQRHFVEKPSPVWEGGEEGTEEKVKKAVYTGGLVRLTKDLSCVSPGPTASVPELAHLVVGLEGAPHSDPDFIPLCTLNMLLGGGGSFSAGGPGKGMYSRLYTNVLNRHHWMYNATAYNHTYNDSGVLCIHASGSPEQLEDLAKVVVKELVNMAGPVKECELSRAKAQLQSMLLMNLEARPIMFEDIGRQVLATGHRKPPSYFLKAIGEVTAEDIQRVAMRLLRSRPAVAALGRLNKLPRYEDIVAGLSHKDGLLPSRRTTTFSLFR